MLSYLAIVKNRLITYWVRIQLRIILEEDRDTVIIIIECKQLNKLEQLLFSYAREQTDK